MEWSDLLVFLAIAREGKLEAAARKLGKSRPTMGRRLRVLEDSMGLVLFQRADEGLVLTHEGRVVLSHAEQIEREVFAIQRHIAGRDQNIDGILRVSASEWFAIHFLSPALADFRQQQPRVIINLSTGVQYCSLSRGDADLVFQAKPFDEPDVVSRRLMQIQYGIYLKTEIEPPQVGGGAGSSLLVVDAGADGISGERSDELSDATWLQHIFPLARIVSRSDSVDVAARLCALGVGIALLPRLLGDSLVGVRRIDAGTEPPGGEVWLGYHCDMRRLPRLRALVEMLMERGEELRRAG